MKINDRMKELRTTLSLSQEAFGSKIGIAGSGISNIEKGLRSVTERHIKLMVSEFNVSEEWLRTGEGTVFIKTDASIFDELTKQFGLDELDRAILETYLELPASARDAVKAYARSLTAKIVQHDAVRATEEYTSRISADLANVHPNPSQGDTKKKQA